MATNKLKSKVVQTKPEASQETPPSRRSSWRTFLEEFGKIKSDLENNNLVKACDIVSKEIEALIKISKLDSIYNIIFLLQDDEFSITSRTSDKIYSALAVGDKNKKTLLIINSSGGSIEPAYFIGKACKEYSASFCAAVPRRAKSAATLISLGADEIHMGSVSELGPIDPQIRRMPALALGEAVEYLASISEKYPDSAEMFARFMSRKLDLQTLGHTRRIADSAIQYAIRLLKSKVKILPKTPKEIGEKLVREYKDHGFVIDKDEAKEILGDKVVKISTAEYDLSNQLYKVIEEAKLALWAVTRVNFTVEFVGTVNDVSFEKQEESQ